MATVLYPPYTKEDILNAQISGLKKEYKRLSKENSVLMYKVENLRTKVYFLCGAIETARQEWSRIGATKSLSNLVLLLKKYPAEQSVQLTAFGTGWRVRLGYYLIRLGCRLTYCKPASQ